MHCLKTVVQTRLLHDGIGHITRLHIFRDNLNAGVIGPVFVRAFSWLQKPVSVCFLAGL